MRYELGRIAEIVKGTVTGDESTVIDGVSAVEECGPGDITLALDQRRLETAHSRNPAAVIVPDNLRQRFRESMSYIVSDNPKMAFLRTLELFDLGLHMPAIYLLPLLSAKTSSSRCSVERCLHWPGSVIGSGTCCVQRGLHRAQVEIGKDCVLFPNCVVMDRSAMGSHAGCVIVIGLDMCSMERTRQDAHIGRVIIEDDVEVGANSCIDRATTAATVVARGTKIDNLVQVAHNVKIGELCILVASAALRAAVSSAICVFSEASRVSDHTTVGSRTISWPTL